jgi:hypothetical protein
MDAAQRLWSVYTIDHTGPVNITKSMHRNMDSLEEAIYKSCHEYPGKIKALASDLSIAQGTLYNKCSPGMTSHCVNLQEALEIMRLSRDFSILEVLCRKTHHACVLNATFRHVSDMVLFDAWTACDMEHGKTVTLIREALADKRIDDMEFRKIRSEMFIDFARELELLDRLRQYAGLAIPPPSTDPVPLSACIAETITTCTQNLAALAESIGMREVDLRKKSDPARPDGILTLQETLKLMQASENYAILHALAGLLDHTCIPIPRYDGIDDMELLDAWSSWSDERSDTVSSIHDALVDGKMVSRELEQIEREMFQEFHTELALLARLRLMIQ